MDKLSLNIISSKSNRIPVIAAVILAAFTFSFLHSEFGFLNYDGDDHSAHDYCTIVKYASNQTIKIVKKDILKPLAVQPVLINDDCLSNKPLLSVNQFKSDQSQTGQQTTEVYIFNRTILI